MDIQAQILRSRDSTPETVFTYDPEILLAKKVRATSNVNLHCAFCGLRNICVTKSASAATVELLRTLSNPSRPLHKGQNIYAQDQAFESLYILRSGAVKTYYINKRGVVHVTGFILPGELFGFDGLGRGRHRYAAVSLDTSAICRISYESIERKLQFDPDLHRWLVEMLCEEIYDRQESLLALRTVSAEERLATFLLDIISRFKHRGLSPNEIVLPMTRRDIAGYLGLTEETMSRMFTRLQKRKVLVVDGRTIFINDQNALQRLSLTGFNGQQSKSKIYSSR